MNVDLPPPPKRRPWSFSGWQTLTLAIFLLAVLARLVPGPRTIDDSFITYRYAENILAGNGFTYNPGERVLGTTTPLYTILLTLLALPAGGVNAPFPLLSLAVNALADALTCLLLIQIGRRLKAPFAAAGAALTWAIAPFSVTFAIGGLETSVYVLILTAAAYCHLARRHPIAAFLAALAFLTRPDALLFIAPLGLARLLTVYAQRRQLARSALSRLAGEAAAFLLPASAWLAFATVYFGSPLPHSIAAKSLAYRLPPEAAFVRLLQHYATPFLEHLTFGAAAIAAGLALYLFLSLLGVRRLLRQESAVWPWLVYPWLYFIVFAAANPLIFRWYLTPPLPVYFFTLLAGAEGLLLHLAARMNRVASTAAPALRHHPFQAALLALVVVCLPALLSARDWTLHPDHGLDQPAPRMAYYQLELLYRQAAESLAAEFAAQPAPLLLAAGDVGVLGYFTGARILDTVGLNSPISTRYYPLDESYYAINYAIPPDLILDQMPDYIVVLEVYIRNGLLKDPRFQHAFELRQVIPTQIYGSRGMHLYARRP
ncbi:MAG: hypothetical protein L0Z70_14575 [Chloroflexi bacterium]|nr:hypothetical protein [Chloroflexota bacterium]